MEGTPDPGRVAGSEVWLMRKTYYPAVAAAIATGLSLVVGTPAFTSAAYTFTKSNSDEIGVADVLAHVYGGQFNASGADYTGDTTGLTARRVSDNADQLWTGSYSAKVVGRFSGYTQAFGYLSPAGFQQLAEAPEEGFNATVGDRFDVTLAAPTALARSGNSGAQSSRNVDNRDNRDHMITYAVEGLTNGASVWILFWEDLNLGPKVSKGRSSSDFNDLVVVLRTADAGVVPIAVPLPPAFGVGLASLVAGVWFGRRALKSRRTIVV